MVSRTVWAVMALAALTGCGLIDDSSAPPTPSVPLTATQPVLPQSLGDGLPVVNQMADRLSDMEIRLGDPVSVAPSGSATFSGVMEVLDASSGDLLHGDVVLNTRWDNGSTRGIAGNFLDLDGAALTGELRGHGAFAANEGRYTLELPMVGVLSGEAGQTERYDFTMLGTLQHVGTGYGVAAGSVPSESGDVANFAVHTVPAD